MTKARGDIKNDTFRLVIQRWSKGFSFPLNWNFSSYWLHGWQQCKIASPRGSQIKQDVIMTKSRGEINGTSGVERG